MYGKLTPSLLANTRNEIHLCDIATGQLQLARRKTLNFGDGCRLARMNAECLAYRDNSFDQVIVFFLFHEMPAEPGIKPMPKSRACCARENRC